ncbi:MAG: phosphoribosylglycinamide formyltransferase [Campylobacterales bacterium]|nr:phosphoribosylglycinamide formyltransferase [Campylobacterales bacterium]
MKNIAILASHNGSVIDPIMEAIKSNKLSYNIVTVVTNNQNANVIQKANNYNIPSKVINNNLFENSDKELENYLESFQIDMILLAGYMKKIPKNIVEKYYIINSHPSLLPKYGGHGMYGIKVHEAVIEACETTSGVTIHEVTQNYDEGKILLQKSFKVETKSPQILEEQIKKLEALAVIEVLEKLFLKGK